jgi:hypothetical protein
VAVNDVAQNLGYAVGLNNKYHHHEEQKWGFHGAFKVKIELITGI